MAQRADNFGYLCSTTVYEQPMTTTLKKGMLEMFNRRPDNIYGDLIRIIVADGGFKEGIDLFDVKYVHLFEPLVSEADQKQAIGRATRKCGQAGLQFIPMVGWTLNVFIYDTLLSEKLLTKLDSNSLYDLYLKNSNIDLRRMNFGKQLEQLVVIGAIDYPLNKNLISIENDEPLFGGDDAPSGNNTKQNVRQLNTSTQQLVLNAANPIVSPLNTTINAPINTPTNAPINTQVNTLLNTPTNTPINTQVNTPMNANVGLNTTVTQPINVGVGAETQLPKTTRRSPVPPKLGDKVYCHRICSVNRPSKYVPVSLPLFAVVAIVVGAPLPNKKIKKPRTAFCEMLKSNNEYCSNVKVAFTDPKNYIRKNSNILLEAIEDGVHTKLGKTVRYAFLRYVYNFLPKVVQDKIVDMPNVQRALEQENSTVSTTSSSSSSNTTVSYITNVNNISNSVNATAEEKHNVNNKSSRKSASVAFDRDGFKYMLENVPRFTEKMDFVRTREFVVDNYGIFKWDKPKLENLCKNTWDVPSVNTVNKAVGGASDTRITANVNAVSNLLKEMDDEIEMALKDANAWDFI
jgi:hypothetical protein